MGACWLVLILVGVVCSARARYGTGSRQQRMGRGLVWSEDVQSMQFYSTTSRALPVYYCDTTVAYSIRISTPELA